MATIRGDVSILISLDFGSNPKVRTLSQLCLSLSLWLSKFRCQPLSEKLTLCRNIGRLVKADPALSEYVGIFIFFD